MEERRVARGVEPPADAERVLGSTRSPKRRSAWISPPNGMYWNVFSPAFPQRRALTVRIAPWSSIRTRTSGCSGGRSKRATMTFSVSARQVTPRPGSTLGGANTTLSIAARVAADRAVLASCGVKQGHAPEQAALGAAGGVCVVVGDAQRRQRPAPDAGSPREGSAVDRLLGGERQPEADLDAPAHRHADAVGERGAVADGVAEVASDGLVETREHVRGEAARGVRRRRHERSVACRGVVGVAGTRAMRGRSRPALRAARSR